MRAMIIGPEQKKQIEQCVAYSKDYYYVIEKRIPVGQPPGNDFHHVVFIPDGYRCVFSFTLVDGKELFRHLSVSVDRAGKYPSPASAFAIAEEFGFTGYPGGEVPGKDWLIDVTQVDNCITLAQKIENL